MKVSELCTALGLEVIVKGDDRDVTCGYAGDLLSWVMGRAPADCAWVTVMSNKNVVAVASLSDAACVIIAEGAVLDEDAHARADAEGINILASPLDTFTLCSRIAKLLE